MHELKRGDSVGLIACSDGLTERERPAVESITDWLTSCGLNVRVARTLYRQASTPFSGSPQARAAELMRLFADSNVRMIADVSGGDSANEILPYLDFSLIARSPAFFAGISDLSVLNNAFYTRCARSSLHYRAMNLAGRHAQAQRQWFTATLLSRASQPRPALCWLRGHMMRGTLVGGNIRCFLKLAGTDYFPNPSGKIVLLESLGGLAARTASLLAQLDQLGVFQSCAGVLLGTFSQLERSNETPTAAELTLRITERYRLPVAQTMMIGHGSDAIGLFIGDELSLGTSGE
ncbi:MAG: LD-carboxypeptidase [Sporolactobacillus sp.]